MLDTVKTTWYYVDTKKEVKEMTKQDKGGKIMKQNYEVFNLRAQYTHVKSHYGKAKVEIIDDIMRLLSYNTHVATYNTSTKQLEILGTYSQTTMRHLKDFINQYTHYYVSDNNAIRALIKELKEEKEVK